MLLLLLRSDGVTQQNLNTRMRDHWWVVGLRDFSSIYYYLLLNLIPLDLSVFIILYAGSKLSSTAIFLHCVERFDCLYKKIFNSCNGVIGLL